MKLSLHQMDRVRRIASELRGVLTVQDIRIALGAKSSQSCARAVKALIDSGVLKRFSRGLYVTKDFSLPVLSRKIEPSSYISFEYVLARNLLIGTQPENEIKAVKIGKKRVYESPMATVVHLGIQKSLYFGFETKDGVQYATNEKAFLDALYFYQKGYRFAFDVYSDVDVSRLNLNTLEDFLTRYKNPKFCSFVRGIL